MMLLLKYDLRRNMDRLLSTLGLLAAFQLLLLLLWAINADWDPGTKSSLSMMAYVLTAFLLFASICHTYHYGLTMAHRRMLPLHPLKHVVSSLLQGLIYVFFVMILYWVQLSLENNAQYVFFGSGWDWTVSFIETIIWLAYWYGLLFLCITVSCCFQWAGRRLIGFCLFIALVFTVSFIEGKLAIGEIGLPIGIRFESGGELVVLTPNAAGEALESVLFYAVLAAAFLFVSGYLAGKRVEG